MRSASGATTSAAKRRKVCLRQGMLLIQVHPAELHVRMREEPPRAGQCRSTTGGSLSALHCGSAATARNSAKSRPTSRNRLSSRSSSATIASIA